MNTTGPHFALAQHPETGEWALMQWLGNVGCLWWAPVHHDDRWHPDRVTALAQGRQEIRIQSSRWPVWDAQEHLTTLDRLIAHEQEMQAGDEAAVQTIQALTGE